MSFTLSTSGAIMRKMGIGANTFISQSGAALANWCDQAEGWFSAAVGLDLVALYPGIPANLRPMLEAGVSAKAAIQGINYDMSGYTNTNEATTMLDVLDDEVSKCITLINAIVGKSLFGLNNATS